MRIRTSGAGVRPRFRVRPVAPRPPGAVAPSHPRTVEEGAVAYRKSPVASPAAPTRYPTH